MKTKIKIPNGWERLREGQKIKRGDRFRSGYSWQETRHPGWLVGWDREIGHTYSYIRRIKRKAVK